MNAFTLCTSLTGRDSQVNGQGTGIGNLFIAWQQGISIKISTCTTQSISLSKQSDLEIALTLLSRQAITNVREPKFCSECSHKYIASM